MDTHTLLIRRGTWQHRVASLVTALAIALAGGLAMTIFAIQGQTRRAFVMEQMGFDGVLGARGSQLQLVLNAVYHLETSPGNLPWRLYQDIKNHPQVELAIPYALGDNYYGFRLVGTTTELFTHLEPRAGEPFCFAAGQAFASDQRQAVMGSFAAAETGLRVGDIFSPFHGLTFDPQAQHAEVFTVAGVLAPTNTPSDRVIWIPLDAVYRLGGHVLRGGGQVYAPQAEQAIPDEHKEVSAVLIKVSDPLSGMMLDQAINRQGQVATLAYPVARVMLALFDKLGWGLRILEWVAVLVVLVAGAGVLASLYATLNERRREFAILRALGAHRRTIFIVVTGQAALIGLWGAIGALAVYGTLMAIAAWVVRVRVGVHFAIWELEPALWVGPPALILVAALAGLPTAWRACRTEVAGALAPSS